MRFRMSQRFFLWALAFVLVIVLIGGVFKSTPRAADSLKTHYRFENNLHTVEVLSDKIEILSLGKVQHQCILSGFSLEGAFTKPTPRVWTLGESASVRFPVIRPGDRELLIRCIPLVYPNAPQQTVAVHVNRHFVTNLPLRPRDFSYQVRIPSDLVRPGWNNLTFGFSTYTVPCDVIPQSGDSRKLAVNFAKLAVVPAGTNGRKDINEHVKSLEEEGENLIFQRCPSIVNFHKRIPLDAEVTVNLRVPDTVSKSKIESITFEIVLNRDGKDPVTLASESLKPRGLDAEPESTTIKTSLSEYAGQIAQLSFQCDAVPLEYADRAAVHWKGELTGSSSLEASRNEKSSPPKSIVLISLDTLRADHLGCYGYEKETSPFLDSFARECTVFERAYSHAPSTLASHGVMLTSLYPALHRGEYSTQTALRSDVPTIAEILKGEGYTTVAFTGGGQLDREFKVDRGFDLYEQVERNFEKTVTISSSWLQENKPGKFFLFLHTYQVHAPYEPPKKYRNLFTKGYAGPLSCPVDRPDIEKLENAGTLTPEDVQYVKGLYNEEIRFTDDCLKRFIQWMKEHQLYDDSLIIITSDHGEEFGEHGVVGTHSHTQYEELLHVPLIIKWPQGRLQPGRISTLVRLADLLPTVLECVGLPSLPGAVGTSVIPLVEEPRNAIDRECYGQMEKVVEESLNFDHWKVIVNRMTTLSNRTRNLELYNLGKDPRETEEISEQFPICTGYALSRMAEIRSRILRNLQEKPITEEDRITLSEDLKKKLKGLGYAE